MSFSKWSSWIVPLGDNKPVIDFLAFHLFKPLFFRLASIWDYVFCFFCKGPPMEGWGAKDCIIGQRLPAEKKRGRHGATLICFSSKGKFLGGVAMCFDEVVSCWFSRNFEFLLGIYRAWLVWAQFVRLTWRNLQLSAQWFARFTTGPPAIGKTSPALWAQQPRCLCAGQTSYLWHGAEPTSFASLTRRWKKQDASILGAAWWHSRINWSLEARGPFRIQHCPWSLSAICQSIALLQDSCWCWVQAALACPTAEIFRDWWDSRTGACLRTIASQGAEGEATSIASAISPKFLKRLTCGWQSWKIKCNVLTLI